MSELPLYVTLYTPNLKQPVLLISNLALAIGALRTMKASQVSNGTYANTKGTYTNSFLWVPSPVRGIRVSFCCYEGVQGHLAHKKIPTPLGPPKDLRHRPTVGS